MKRITLLLLLAATVKVVAQGEIPVNMYTGTPGIGINLYTLTDHDLSEALTLSYDVNSPNYSTVTSYGGWRLQVGGQISRTVRGLPDDYTDGQANGRRGWLYSSGISGFPGTSSTSASTCDNFQDDYNYLKLNYLVDTEPDMFSYSVGGYSGKFVLDNAGNVQLIPFQDIIITPTFNSPTDKTIIGWTIKTNNGLIYTFNDKTSTVRKITKPDATQSYLSIFDRLFNFYTGTAVTYTSAWNLTTVASPTGAALSYSYRTANDASSTVDNHPALLFNPETGVDSTILNLMADSTRTAMRIVNKITTSCGKWITCDPVTGINIYDTLASPVLFKTFAMTYSYGMLTKVTETSNASCIQLPPYQFTYNSWPTQAGVDFWGYSNGVDYTGPAYNNFPTVYIYPNELADERYRLYAIPSYSGTQIVLGTGQPRMPSSVYATSGALSTITYPTGGVATFAFEINQYYDSRAGIDQLGGGLRIKSITYKDRLNPSADMTKSFSYVDANGHSSGKLISKPTFAIPLWQQKVPALTFSGTQYSAHSTLYSAIPTNQVWKNLIAVTSSDVSAHGDTQGSTVGYSHVTVSRVGSGKVVYDYYVPAAYGDPATGADSTSWSPTLMKFARPTTCPNMGLITQAETYGYSPFPQAEYDYERGLVWKKSEFNEANTLVRLTQTSYQYQFKTGVLKSISGIAYDVFGNSANFDGNSNAVYLYGKYKLITNLAKVVASQSVTTYDENNIAKSMTSSTNYSYSTTNYFMNKVSSTAADGTIYNTYLKYVPDYAPTSSQADTTSYMIYLLKNANRTNTVIEQYSTVQPTGGTEKLTSASLVKYRPFNFSKPLLRYQLALRPSSLLKLNGSNSFTPSSIDQSNIFHHDSRYDTVQTVNEYDAYDMPISATGENSVTAGSLVENVYHRVPVVQFGSSRSTNIGFSDFENTTSASFSLSHNYYYGPGRTGLRGFHPYDTLTRTVTRPSTAANYLLSLWAKPNGGNALTLNISLSWNGGSSSVSWPLTFDATSSDYQYFTKLIPVSGVPASSPFTIQITGQSLSQPSGLVGSLNPSLLPLLDDVSFCPDYSSISSLTFSVPYGATSATDASGNSAFTTYDAIGRPILSIDQDHNIRQRYTYTLAGQVYAQLKAAVATVANTKVGQGTTLTAAPNPCFPGATYRWDFVGDGHHFGSPSTSLVSPTNTYSTIGAKPVYLKVTDASGKIADSVLLSVNIVTQYDVLSVTTDAVYSGVGNSFVTVVASMSNDDGQPVSYAWSTWNGWTDGNWNPTSVTGNVFTQKINPNTSFYVKCTVTSADGRVASAVQFVSNN